MLWKVWSTCAPQAINWVTWPCTVGNTTLNLLMYCTVFMEYFELECTRYLSHIAFVRKHFQLILWCNFLDLFRSLCYSTFVRFLKHYLSVHIHTYLQAADGFSWCVNREKVPPRPQGQRTEPENQGLPVSKNYEGVVWLLLFCIQSVASKVIGCLLFAVFNLQFLICSF